MVPQELVYLSVHDIQQRNGQYYIQIPSEHIESGSLDQSKQYRIALIDTVDSSQTESQYLDRHSDESDSSNFDQGQRDQPPVSEGDVLTVEVDSTGEKGDGIAHVAGGYVVVVEGGTVGEEITVRIDTVKRNYSFATIIDGSDQVSQTNSSNTTR